jgi:hypothetical protein
LRMTEGRHDPIGPTFGGSLSVSLKVISQV